MSFQTNTVHSATTRCRPWLSEDGVLDDLNKVAAEMAGCATTDSTEQRHNGPPPAPEKPRERKRSILRRVSSVTGGNSIHTIPNAVTTNGRTRQAARRLTWHDANDGQLEHVQEFHTGDGMSSCSQACPDSSRSRRKLLCTRSQSTTSTISFNSSFTSSFYSDSDVIIPCSSLDRTAQHAVQCIAKQLMKHEDTIGDTSELTPAALCGKMFRCRLTAKVATLVEKSSEASGASTSATDNKRAVLTAGDAILTFTVRVGSESK